MTQSIATGQVIGGRYRLDALLGSGGMGAVFRCTDLTTGAACALKQIKAGKDDADLVTRFRREAALTAQLQDDHIVKVLDSGEHEGALYLVMEIVAGESLRARLIESGAMSVAEALRVARELAHALAVAHAGHIVHRDVKPANIMLSHRADGTPRTVLLDFGVARSIDHGATMTSSGVFVGTPGYIAPEVAIGGRAFDARSDLYSLGMVLYEMLVGAPPFMAANALALTARQASEDPTPPHAREPSVPEAVSAYVMRLVSRAPERRPSSAQKVAEALDALLEARRAADPSVEGAPLDERGEYLELLFDPLTRIVRFKRTSKPYPTADDAGAAFSMVREMFPVAARADKALLVDARDAPMRTDARFASIMIGELPRLYEGWRRVATLVRTLEGQQQLAVLRARMGRPGQAFLDEESALVYLLADEAP